MDTTRVGVNGDDSSEPTAFLPAKHHAEIDGCLEIEPSRMQGAIAVEDTALPKIRVKISYSP